jgi:DnaJ-class molecular chaperone
MIQNVSFENRYCPDCGNDTSTICPMCHGLGYIQSLPSFTGFIITSCPHANERGEYCSMCGSKIQQDLMINTCGTCMGKGWVISQSHYCLKKVTIPSRPNV